MCMTSNRQKGFSLIEMMIGLVAGLIVIGAVSSFTVTTLRATNQNTQSSRLTQDLRTAMTLVTRELRRAGYDGAAVTKLGSGASLSGYTTLSVANGCLVYQYNRTAGNQYRAIRLNSNALEMATATAAMTDCSAGTWNQVTDLDVVNITAFNLNQTKVNFSAVIDSRAVGGKTEITAGCGTVRHIGIDIRGSLVADSGTSRTVHQDVRVRADPIKFMKETYDGTGDHSADEVALRTKCEGSL